MERTTKIIPLSLAKDYVREWGVEQAVRELIQNCLDCLDHEVFINNGCLNLNSFDGKISHKDLLLGSGSKTVGGNTRGGFNEGLKLALLVMARENINITFENGDETWTPFIAHSEVFEQECLHVKIEYNAPDYNYEDSSVRITIQGLGEDGNPIDEGYGVGEPSTLDRIITNTLQLQDEGYSKHETSYGDILLEPQHKGKVYCGGLYVGTINKLDEGFDMKPKYIKLDRDRSCISVWDHCWIAKEMWGEVSIDAEGQVANGIAKSLRAGSASTEYLHHANNKVSEEVKNAVFDLYNEEYSGKLLATSHEEKEKLVSEGNPNADYIGKESFVRVLQQSEGYQEILLSKKTEKPVDLLETFKDKWYDSFSTEMLHEFEDMAEKLNKLLK